MIEKIKRPGKPVELPASAEELFFTIHQYDDAQIKELAEKVDREIRLKEYNFSSQNIEHLSLDDQDYYTEWLKQLDQMLALIKRVLEQRGLTMQLSASVGERLGRLEAVYFDVEVDESMQALSQLFVENGLQIGIVHYHFFTNGDGVKSLYDFGQYLEKETVENGTSWVATYHVPILNKIGIPTDNVSDEKIKKLGSGVMNINTRLHDLFSRKV
ncbi:MAG: hypothetical protein WAU07_05755 [Microgenomates group bacterium]